MRMDDAVIDLHRFLATFNTMEIEHMISGSIFGKRDILAIDHIMLALFWSYSPNMK